MAAADTIAGPSASVRGNRIAVGSAAAIGVAATLALFWPGLMSVDSAVQFAQERFGKDPLHLAAVAQRPAARLEQPFLLMRHEGGAVGDVGGDQLRELVGGERLGQDECYHGDG